MTVFLNYPRSQVIASAGSSPSESRRRISNTQSKRISPGRSPLVHVHSGQDATSTPSTGLICSSTAVADSSVRIYERNEFRRGVGLCVVNREGLVFAAKRMDDRENTWQMPQGGIDPYENPLVAAVRELREETGITSVNIVSTMDRWLEYEWATKVKCDITGQVIRYRGQTQKWMLLHFTGHDDEIDISCHGVPEFSEWQWMHLEELPHSVVDFKKGVYEAVAGHFAPHIKRLHGQGNIVSKFPLPSVVVGSKLVN